MADLSEVMADFFIDGDGKVHCCHCDWVSGWDDDDSPGISWAMHDLVVMHTYSGINNRLVMDNFATRDP